MSVQDKKERAVEGAWLRSLEKLADEQEMRRSALPHELKDIFLKERERADRTSRAQVQAYEAATRAKLKDYEEESLRLLEKANEEAQERTRGALEEDIAADVARALRAILGREDVAP